ncbi:MAG: hypothetical protein QOE54_2556 [Streptosporangiaceae bacterium]|nr:hypothetical protein [Streptosporangiaceae bacterium]
MGVQREPQQRQSERKREGAGQPLPARRAHQAADDQVAGEHPGGDRCEQQTGRVRRADLRADGPRRFSELKGHIRGITPKVLTETLRSLEADGLISRHEYDENPPRVEYALTPLGRSLLIPLRAVRLWAEEHVPDIEAARARQPILCPRSRLPA